ncbi:MAG TPA: DUF4150 domain-containing protein [Albitalea sp.]|uniref:DUF4150 domain-containing protein n=1 Tax=Piscinibacter sp. TaxID=1903157 RepID=UPI002ED5084F
MALTVFAENMGFFHKGSGGFAVAPGDVCLTPPTPPAGPLPVPYVNNLKAGDLSKGSKSVLIDGEPTALEDQSEVATSTGDEAGTQGGNVITHKTKGKGIFNLWSFTVQVEGKGVCRHGDMMGQNGASAPQGCYDMQAVASFNPPGWVKMGQPCTKPYVRPAEGDPNAAQRAAIAGQTCWWNGCSNPATVPDHQPPLKVAWEQGGCHNEAKYKAWAASTAATPKGHCLSHSRSQGGHVSGFTRTLKAGTSLANALKAL